MKIAIFYNLPFSGAKRTVYEHTRGLKKHGHIVDVYTTNDENDIFNPGDIADIEYRFNYNPFVIKLPFFRKVSNDLNDFKKLKRLHKKIAGDIDSRAYDIALIHTDRITQAPFILRYLKTRNVYFCLEPLKIAYEYSLRAPDNLSLPNKLYESFNRYLRKKIDRENAQAADTSIAISNFGRELMIQAFDLYPKVSYLGVDTDVFKNIGITKKNQVLFVGQKVQINGYQAAVKAIQLIPEKIRPELKILSISKNHGRRVSDKEIVKLYNESLVTLCLSNFDTFGLVTLESLACEVPVVAYNVAGYRETMQDGNTGYLVDFDVQQIADKIIELLLNDRKRISMGENGRKWVERNWTWDQHIQNLELFLAKMSKT